jgi:hypothetical protein
MMKLTSQLLFSALLLAGDHMDHAVIWKGGSLAAHAGKPVRLKLLMQQADLFALQFIP